MNNLAKVIALGGRRLNKALAMHYLFSEKGIPEGYIPLEYIKSTGTQYIDTGIKPSDDMVFEIEYQVMEDTDSGRKLFGCEVGGSSMFNAFKVKKASAAIRAFAGNGAGENGVVTNINTTAGQKTKLKVEIKDGKYTVSVDDVSYPQVAANGTVPELNIYLFAVNRLRGGTTFADSPIPARIYSCKIYKSGALVGDFRPYLNNKGEAGMHNTVDGKFHKNLGTGEFIAGYNLDNYIHDAANLFLDGIWNSGEGAHSDTLTEWVDLSGNCQPTPLNTANTVGTNCVTSDGTANSKMTVPDVELINLTTFTLELIYQKTGVNSKNQPIIGRNYASSYYVNTIGGTLMVWIGNKPISVGKNMDETAMHTLQVTCTGTTATAWVDGIKAAENYAVNAQNTSDKLLLFGSDFISACFDGSIMAVRLHNRILTDEELMQNYEIDKQRFGLTETASVMMLGMPAETITDELEVTEDDSI